MIPFPNVIAGIFIGLVNDTWFQRILIPFGWGIIFCIYNFIVGRDKRFVAESEMRDRKARFGMSHILSFYFIEYATATSSSLFFSIIAGAIREMV